MFVLILRPVDFIGPLVYRVLFTIGSTIHYFIIILLAIAAFATCINLQQTRKYQDDPVDSFYGSILHILFMATGGYDISFLEDADSPLFTSLFFCAFILFVVLIFLIILISATIESYSVSYAISMGAWRAEQARVILQKSYLLPNEENLKPFHNPKWLHILAPVGTIVDFRGENIDDDNIVTGIPALYGIEGGRRGCDCGNSDEMNAATKKFITKEIDEVQDMISELNNKVAAKKCIDVNVLADLLTEKLSSMSLTQTNIPRFIPSIGSMQPQESFSPRISPRVPDGPVPSPYKKPIEQSIRFANDTDADNSKKQGSPRKILKDSRHDHSSIRIRSIKSSKKNFSRQISATADSDDDNEEIKKQYRKKLMHDTFEM